MSDVLFWRQRLKSDDPFLEPTLPAAFYHPSLPKSLTKEESQIKLGPEKLHHEEDKENINTEELTPEGKAFMQKTNTLLAKELPTRDTPSPRDTSSKFEESWPTSERPSTLESPSETRPSRDAENGGNISRTSSSSARSKTGTNVQTKEFNLSTLLKIDNSDYASNQEGKMQSSRASSHHDSRMKKTPLSPHHDSVLARYIHRFRHGEPQSRDERNAKGQSSAAKDLWWLSPPTRDTSVSSSPDTHSHTRSSAVIKHPKVPPSSSSMSSSSFHLQNKRPFTRDRRQGTIPSKSITKGRHLSPSRPDDIPSSSTPVMDAETLLLQEKAQHLLEISESSLSSDPMVSSDGIGSSPSLPSREEKMYIPPADISPIREKDTVEGFTRKSAQIHSRPQKILRPEDDILYQWRLRRKMELAKQGGELNRGPDNLLMGRERTGLGHGVPSRQQDQESTLEAFRARLRQDRLSNHISNIPPHEDRQLSSPAVRTRGTDPIPQTTSTQTGTGEERGELHIPRSFMNSTCHDGDLHPRVQHADSDIAQSQEHHGYSLPSYTVGEQPTVVPGSPPRLTFKQRPIASPNKEVAGQQGYNVLPHWHMSCDIIPCTKGNVPHSHVEDELTRRESQCTRTDPDDRTKDRHQSKERQREAVDEDERLLNGGDKMEVVKDGDDRRNEKQDLKEAQENKRMQLQDKNREESEQKHKQGYMQIRDPIQKKFGFTKRSGIPRLKHRVEGLKKERETENKSSIGEPPVYQPERKYKGTRKDETLDRINDRNKKTSPRSSDTEPFTDMSAEEDRDREDIEGSKQESTTEVQSIIGQVVTRRLFDPDSPKVSKFPSHEPSKSVTRASHSEGVSKQEESTSDSDEFSDDNLLQMLRQKRALYEKQLQQIDDAIASKLHAV